MAATRARMMRKSQNTKKRNNKRSNEDGVSRSGNTIKEGEEDGKKGDIDVECNNRGRRFVLWIIWKMRVQALAEGHLS